MTYPFVPSAVDLGRARGPRLAFVAPALTCYNTKDAEIPPASPRLDRSFLGEGPEDRQLLAVGRDSEGERVRSARPRPAGRGPRIRPSVGMGVGERSDPDWAMGVPSLRRSELRSARASVRRHTATKCRRYVLEGSAGDSRADASDGRGQRTGAVDGCAGSGSYVASCWWRDDRGNRAHVWRRRNDDPQHCSGTAVG